MQHFVYIIQSEFDDSYYVGYSSNVILRVERHNLGRSRSTKSKRPWKLVYQESHINKTEALKRERQIKQMKSRIYIEDLIRHAKGRPD